MTGTSAWRSSTTPTLVLATNSDALDAFRTANRAVAAALSRRLAREGRASAPRWRAFQLAFILLNLPGIAEPANPEREFVDVLFFVASRALPSFILRVTCRSRTR